MTPDEKIEKIRELEKDFLVSIETLKKEYQQKMKALVAEAERIKMESLKKDLGI